MTELESIDARRRALEEHIEVLGACTECPQMHRPVVTGRPTVSPVLLVGQAPGPREGELGRPFAWTAGRTLFGWFGELGVDEETFRQRVYIAATCRCFPGKGPSGGGDRVPSATEIATCSKWLAAEVQILRPELVLPVGKLAISQFLEFGKLTDVVGRQHRATVHGHEVDLIPLPHPSGVSTWHRTEPGKTLLAEALDLLGAHAAWVELFAALTEPNG